MVCGGFIGTMLVSSLCFAQPVQDKINQTDSKGLKQGYWVKKDDNGTLKYEGKFENDKPSGTFKYYYADKKVSSVLEYSEKGTKAKAKLYDKDGKLIGQGNYFNQKKDSLWKYYNHQEKLISEEFYANNKKNGKWKVYYTNGKVASEKSWKDDVENGAWKEYFESGKTKMEAVFTNGQLDGKVVFYYPNGVKLSEGNYSHSLKAGLWFNYNEDGSVHFKENYDKGFLKETIRVNGTFEDYFADGIPKAVTVYKNGLKNGKFKEYYETGKWVREIKNEGTPEAEMVESIEGQTLKMDGMHKNDQLHGKITYYKEDGSVDKVVEYNEGTIVK